MAEISVKSNLSKVLDDISSKIGSIDQSKLSRQIGVSLAAKVIDRIQNEGLASDGNKIGSYSTKETVINDPNFAKTRVPKGGGKGSKFEFQPISQPSKKGKKGYYGVLFKGGYKEFRQTLGLNHAFVDVTLTGQMTNDFATTLFIISPDKVALGFSNAVNSDKAGYMADKYGEMFELTNEEIILAGKLATELITKQLK